MSRYKPSQGFTLIEVLIAMTLLGIMVVLLFSSMKICADSWQKGEDKITKVNDVAVVYQFFQHHLAAAMPLWDDFSEENNKLFSFQGSIQEVKFVSSFPASAKKAGLQLFSLKLIKDEDEQILQVSITPFYPLEKGEEWRKEEVTLLRHVRSFALNYFSSDVSQVEPIWNEDWLGQETIPRLVKIRVVTDDDNIWPEMIVELKSEPIQSNSDGQSINDNSQAVDDSLMNGRGE